MNMPWRPDNGEEVSAEFMDKISFHMLQITMHPHRSIEFTEKFMSDSRACNHTKRVCRKLIDRLNKFRPNESKPELKNLQFAAKFMSNNNNSDHFARAAGMWLEWMIREILNPSSALEHLENASF